MHCALNVMSAIRTLVLWNVTLTLPLAGNWIANGPLNVRSAALT